MKNILYIGQAFLKQLLLNNIVDDDVYMFDPESIGSAKILMHKTKLDLIIIENQNNDPIFHNNLNQVFNNLNQQKLTLLVVRNMDEKIIITNIWLSSEKKCTLSFEGEMVFSEYLNNFEYDG